LIKNIYAIILKTEIFYNNYLIFYELFYESDENMKNIMIW